MLVWANESVCVCGEEADEVETQVISQPLHPKMAKFIRLCVLVSACSAVSWCVECPVVLLLLLWFFVMAVPLCSEICSQFEFGGLCTELDLGFKWISFNVMNQVRIFTMSAHSVAIYVCVC